MAMPLSRRTYMLTVDPRCPRPGGRRREPPRHPACHPSLLSAAPSALCFICFVFFGSAPSSTAESLLHASTADAAAAYEAGPNTFSRQRLNDGSILIGRQGAGAAFHQAAVFPFQLPDFGPVDAPFENAQFIFHLSNKENVGSFNVDLYGLPSRSSSAVLPASPSTTNRGDFFMGGFLGGPADDDTPGVVKIQDNILAPSTPTGRIPTGFAGSAGLAAYLNAQYDGGNGAGSWVFLRLSTDAVPGGTHRYTVSTANHSNPENRPHIRYNFDPGPEDLYIRIGSDPTFQELIDSGVIVPGEENFPSTGPVDGSTIEVNQALLQQQTGGLPALPGGYRIHTQVNSSVLPSNFSNFSRWYQEDGNVQVMRLFEGEQNVRFGIGPDGSPGRIEAFFPPFTVQPNTWSVWEGTYTIVEPLGCNIFQLFHEGGQLWAFHIRMTSTGNITFNRRRDIAGLPTNLTIATGMVGRSFSLMVRGNGRDYDVYIRIPDENPNWQLVTTGHYTAAVDDRISCRWGMYVGSQSGQTVPKDGMIFVSGVQRYAVAAPGGNAPPPPQPEPVTYYWDNNGAEPGFGTAAGVWGAPTTGNTNQGWSTDPAGETLPQDVTTNLVDPVFFGTFTNGLGGGTIEVGTTVNSADITFGAASGNITLDGGGIAMEGNHAIRVAGTGGTHTIRSVLSGGGSRTIGGGGTLVLTGANTFTGPLVIGDDTNSNLRLSVDSIADADGTPSAAGAPATTADGIIQIGAASRTSTLELRDSTAARSTNRRIRIGSDGTGSGGARIWNNNTDPAHTLTFTNNSFNVAATDTASFNRTLFLGGSNTGANTIRGAIIDNSGGSGGEVRLTKSGSGTWVLAGANTYTGTTTVSAGVLQIGDGGTSGTLGDNSNTTIAAGAELRIHRTDPFGYQYSGTLSGGGTVTIPAGDNRFDLRGGDQTDSGDLSFLVDGTLAVRTTDGIQNVHLGELGGAGRIQRGGTTGGAATLVIGGRGSDSTFSGVISSNELGIEKTGPGTLTLTSADHDFGGATLVSEGTLALAGAGLASPVTVAEGAALAFTPGAPATSSSSVDLTNGSVKISGPVDGDTDHLLMTAAGGITGTPTLDEPIPDYALELRENGTRLVLARVGGTPAFGLWSGGTAADEDTNGDGVPNAVAWALGADGPLDDARGLLPVLDATGDADHLLFSFPRGNAAAADPGTTIAVEYGTDLVNWTTAVHDGDDVIIEAATGTPADTVVVKLRRMTLAPAGRLFVRLKVTVLPESSP